MIVDEDVGRPHHAPLNMDRNCTISPTFGTCIPSILSQDSSCSSSNGVYDHKNPQVDADMSPAVPSLLPPDS